MPKPTQYATPICIVLSIIALIGVILGFYLKNPLIPTILVLPAVAYEVYRTEGESTRWSSIGILLLIIAELVLIVAKINFDLASYLGEGEKYVGGYLVPLGDIKVLTPVIIAVLSIVLFFRTNGKYTKWLAVVIFAACFSVIYIINPSFFSQLIRLVVGEGLYRIRY